MTNSYGYLQSGAVKILLTPGPRVLQENKQKYKLPYFTGANAKCPQKRCGCMQDCGISEKGRQSFPAGSRNGSEEKAALAEPGSI